eukprot:TRINITY_DN24124_c0_g1_i1.p1 TRINITY_DN24124_c0_g1~~TRINITY_DN24124_c0_g1_i1.p1  ORF type:complete len:133 (+),score=20.46 TRINITY_DN24124_c0_g1_i1:38-436(+)
MTDTSDEEPLLMPGGKDEERQNLLGGTSENEDEDFFLNGPKIKFSKSLQGVKGQVEEVTGIMRENMAKIVDRGNQLTELGERSENLSQMSDEFLRQGTRIRQVAWWQQKKPLLIGGSIASLLIVLLIIILSG